MTISYAIGKNSTEGRTHTMCIEGTQGTEGRAWRGQEPVCELLESGAPGSGDPAGLSCMFLPLLPNVKERDAKVPGGCGETHQGWVWEPSS